MLQTNTLSELTPIAPEALPVAALREHLRLGSGFAGVDLQEDLLRSFLRAALAAIEARTGKVVLARIFTLTLTEWAEPSAQPLPLAPVGAIQSLTVKGPGDAGAEVIDPSRYHLLPDTHRPRLIARGAALPMIPTEGQAVITLTAGFGDWDAVPPDMAQAVLMLAAHYYEYRDDTGLKSGCMPFGVTALIERHRALRIGGAA
jgi:uncharacterized phiE125 gp8 family phage protein